MAESAIRRAETNDFSEVCFLTASLNVRRRRTLHWFKSCIFCCYQVGLLHQVLSSPFMKQEAAEAAGYAARPPTWAESLRVSCSSWIVHQRKDSGKTCSTRICLNGIFFIQRNAFSNTINCSINKMFNIKWVIYLFIKDSHTIETGKHIHTFLKSDSFIVARSGCTASRLLTGPIAQWFSPGLQVWRSLVQILQLESLVTGQNEW